MADKRSRGVTIFAWSIIIINILGLLHSFNFKSTASLHKSFNIIIVALIIAYTILSELIGIISGVGILKLKDSMRKLAIWINSLDIVFCVMLFIFSIKDFKDYAYSIAAAEVAKNPTPVSVDTLAGVGFYSVAFLFAIYLLINLLFIFFLTRPKVKGQFSH